MRDLTEQERQKMIQQAKEGDPKANYELALWALDQAEEEPEEERWNRLAAKCMVKAAQAGYAPAIEHTASLIHQVEAAQAEKPAQPATEKPAEPIPIRPKKPTLRVIQPEETVQETEPKQESERRANVDEFDWDGYQMPEHERVRMEDNPGMAAKVAAGVIVAGRAAGSGLKNMIQEIGQARQAKADQKQKKSGSHSAGAHSAKSGVLAGLFSHWEDSKWKRVQVAGIALCVVLAIIITGIIISGRKSATEEAEDTTVVPTPETNEVIVYDTADLITDYPDDDTKAEIAAASLSVYPSDEEYVTEETTAKVSASGGLNLRTGPNSSYNQITLMSSGSTVQVYAYKNGWALVKYQGTTWGWCSQDYLS